MGESTILTQYVCRVHARNRHAALGISVTVYAKTHAEAVRRAINVAWSGQPGDARVTVISVMDVAVSADAAIHDVGPQGGSR